MELEKFIDKSDILLYKGILNKIFKEFDTINHQKLGDLLEKLKELHGNLDNIVHQRKVQSMYDTPYNDRINQLQMKRDKENLERMKNKEEWFNECIKKDSMLLSDIYRVIKNKSNIV